MLYFSALTALTRQRGGAIDHDFIERKTFVIGKNHKIIATFSSKERQPFARSARDKITGDRAATRLQIARQSILYASPYSRWTTPKICSLMCLI
jgi:hypothetical protein